MIYHEAMRYPSVAEELKSLASAALYFRKVFVLVLVEKTTAVTVCDVSDMPVDCFYVFLVNAPFNTGLGRLIM